MKPTKALFAVSILAAATLPTRATSLPSDPSSSIPATTHPFTAHAQADPLDILKEEVPKRLPTTVFFDEKKSVLVTDGYLREHGADLAQGVEAIIVRYLTEDVEDFLNFTVTQIYRLLHALGRSELEEHQRIAQQSREAFACSLCKALMQYNMNMDDVGDAARLIPDCIFCVKQSNKQLKITDLFTTLDSCLLGSLPELYQTRLFALLGPYAGLRNSLVAPEDALGTTLRIPHTVISEKTRKKLSKVFAPIAAHTRDLHLYGNKSPLCYAISAPGESFLNHLICSLPQHKSIWDFIPRTPRR